MPTKKQADAFLKQELKAYAKLAKHDVISEQATFDDKEAKKVKVKEKKIK